MLSAASLVLMRTTIRHTARRQALAAPVAVALVFLLAVLVVMLDGGSGGEASQRTADHLASPSPVSVAGVRLELIVGGRIARATLADTAEARDFAAMLPVTLKMRDRFGQVKTGELPRELDVSQAARSFSYRPGDLSYWSPTGKPAGNIAIVYNAQAQAVPPPGLVPLATIDAGLDAIASADNHFTMTIRRNR